MRRLNLKRASRYAQFCCVSVAIYSGSALGQTTTTPSPASITAFNIERTLSPTAFLSTFTPNIPPATLAAVQSGATEIRESINYSPQNSLLTINDFTVQVGSPLPTPTSTNISTSTFSILSIKVDKVYIGTAPNPSVMFVGTVATSGNGPFGNLAGEPAVVVVGFTTDTPAKINNVVTLIAGTVVAYSPSASGTLTFTQSPITPPGTTGTLQVVIAPVGVVASPLATLDASATTSPNPPLHYAWSVVAGAADIANANSAVAIAYLNGGRNSSYVFQVVVMDAKGATGMQRVSVMFF